MLENMVASYILPTYSNYKPGTTKLKNKVNNFCQSPTVIAVQELKASWKS